MNPIRILIADDHTLFRSIPDTEVVGEAATGEEVVAKAAELGPDVTSWTSRCRR